MRSRLVLTLSIALAVWGGVGLAETEVSGWPEKVRMVLKETEVLKFPRAQRLPLYLWPAMDVDGLDEKTAEGIIQELNKRGVGLISSWRPGQKDQERSLADALLIARIQTRLGLRVNVNANACLYSFFNGDGKTAHIDDKGKPFWDKSFGQSNMGCPLTLDFRRPAMRERIEFFVKAYKQAGVKLDFIFADWEIDGPLEVNGAHEAAQKCSRCCEQIKGLQDFPQFQKAMRELRSSLQRECYAQPILSAYPDALVGNYGVYPHGGLRYWYDYFEYYVPGQPCESDQRAKYRHWYKDFPGTGYTFAMPVVYTWFGIYGWYDFEDTDYRWFYNMLLVASNAGKHTPANIPIISFVHWHTTAPPADAKQEVKQFSAAKYQELLWHMLLRGTDTFFLWSPEQEAAEEIRLLHPVYAAAQEYGEFLEKGVPINFDVPRQPQSIVSGLRLGRKVLVRRTDFGPAVDGAVTVKVEGATLSVPAAPGTCQILDWPEGK